MPSAEIVEETKAQLDEQRLARGVALGLPLVTLSVAVIVGVLIGPATSILVIAAGVLLGVIALLWGSLRILSGDAELSPELASLDVAAKGVDALASRKKMLLRALKDLENEHRIGKLEDDDLEQLSAVYRQELRALLRQIDEQLEPHRAKAEELARTHLVRAGIADAGYRGELPDDDDVADDDAEVVAKPKAKASSKSATKRARVECPKCQASNEPDAKFCKECAEKLTLSTASKASPATSTPEVSDES